MIVVLRETAKILHGSPSIVVIKLSPKSPCEEIRSVLNRKYKNERVSPVFDLGSLMFLSIYKKVKPCHLVREYDVRTRWRGESAPILFPTEAKGQNRENQELVIRAKKQTAQRVEPFVFIFLYNISPKG